MTKLLDEFDKKIIAEIELDYTIPHSKIAHRIKRSKSFVSYRIRRLEEQHIIEYKPLIDYARLGYSYYRILIETTLNKEELLELMKGIALKTVWLVEKLDKDNFVFVILARSNIEFQTLWECVYDRISTQIIHREVSLAYKIYHLPLTFIHGRRDAIFFTGCSHPVDVDDLQIQIIEKLNTNPKITNADLCHALSIHPDTLKSKIKDLEHKEVILAYQTIINKEICNIQHHKIMFDYEFSLQEKKRILEILKQYENIIYITESSGEYDIEFETFVFNNDELRCLLDSLKRETDLKRISITQMGSEQKLI